MQLSSRFCGIFFIIFYNKTKICIYTRISGEKKKKEGSRKMRRYDAVAFAQLTANVYVSGNVICGDSTTRQRICDDFIFYKHRFQFCHRHRSTAHLLGGRIQRSGNISPFNQSAHLEFRKVRRLLPINQNASSEQLHIGTRFMTCE